MTKCAKRITDFFEYVPYKFTLYLLTYKVWCIMTSHLHHCWTVHCQRCACCEIINNIMKCFIPKAFSRKPKPGLVLILVSTWTWPKTRNSVKLLLRQMNKQTLDWLTSSLCSFAAISNEGMMARNDLRMSWCFAMSVARIHLPLTHSDTNI